MSSIFFIVSFGLIPWSINQIVTRSYYVQKNYWFPVWVGTSITFISIIFLKFYTTPSEVGYSTIIISSLWLNMLILSVFLTIRGERIVDKLLVIDFLKIFLIGLGTYFLLVDFNLYPSAPIFEVVFDSLFILLLNLLSLRFVKMKYINLKRIK